MEIIPTLEQAEDQLITIALAKANGNREEAAKMLGISVWVLIKKVTKRRKNDT